MIQFKSLFTKAQQLKALQQPQFGKARPGSNQDRFGHLGPSDSPSWETSPYFHDKRQDYYSESQQYTSFDIYTALKNENDILGLVPKIRDVIKGTNDFKTKLGQAKEAIEKLLRQEKPVEHPSVTLNSGNDGTLNLKNDKEAGWALEFKGKQTGNFRAAGADYTVTYPLEVMNGELQSKETLSPSLQTSAMDYAMQVHPNQDQPGHYALIRVSEEEASTAASEGQEKHAPGSLIDLGNWEPLKALQKTFQVLQSMLSVMKGETSESPSRPSRGGSSYRGGYDDWE